jgi:hypothetical protein
MLAVDLHFSAPKLAVMIRWRQYFCLEHILNEAVDYLALFWGCFARWTVKWLRLCCVNLLLW